MNEKILSDEWRTSKDPTLQRRRTIISLSLINTICMGIVTCYQTGITHSLPDPNNAHFDSRKVVGSSEAYSILSTPDGPLGMVSFASTAALAAAGGGVDRSIAFSALLAAKSIVDLSAAAVLTIYEVKRVRSLCSLCLSTAVSATIIAFLALTDWHLSCERAKSRD